MHKTQIHCYSGHVNVFLLAEAVYANAKVKTRLKRPFADTAASLLISSRVLKLFWITEGIFTPMWSLKCKYRSIKESRSKLNHRIRFSAIYALETVNHFKQTEVQRRDVTLNWKYFSNAVYPLVCFYKTRPVVRFVKTNPCVNNVDGYRFHGLSTVFVFWKRRICSTKQQ